MPARLPYRCARLTIRKEGNQVPIQIGAKPDSGFDDPLGMLRDCHRRIEQFLAVLCRVAERACGRPLSDEEKAVVGEALIYFRTGGQRHTADEEESLFPRLRDAHALAGIDRLEDDHREAAQLHQDLDRLFAEWAASDIPRAGLCEALREKTGRLRGIYTGHIEEEEMVVFARAARVLDETAIQAIGEEFRARRKPVNS